MKELFKNRYINKFLPLYIIILALVILLGTSYALLRSSHTSTNAYTMNVGLLEVSFYGTTNNLTLNNMVPMTDEEGMEQNDNILNFTVKNTGDFIADYDVYIEETSTNPSFKDVIRYSINKADSGYGNSQGKDENNMLYIDKNQTLDVNETVNYKVKFWLSETADNTYMNKTFTARVVITSRQHEETDSIPTMEEMCPNCYFTYITGPSFNYDENGAGIILDDIIYDNHAIVSQDYNEIVNIYERNTFIGVITDDGLTGGTIIRAFSCGMTDSQTPFCVEGYPDDSKQEQNIKILKKIFGEENCNYGENTHCFDDIISVNIDGGNTSVEDLTSNVNSVCLVHDSYFQCNSFDGAIDSCPNCYFMYTTNTYNYDETGENGSVPEVDIIRNGVNVSENYNDIVFDSGKNLFLGVITDDGTTLGTITRAFACGIEPDSETPFCIEGYTDGSKKDRNIAFMKPIFGEEKCDDDVCVKDDLLRVKSSQYGYVYVHSDSNSYRCIVEYNNTFHCIEE